MSGARAGGATVTVTINGLAREVATAPARSLLYVLREELGLTGAKDGCGEGECGACTVIVDGEARRACRVAAADLAGRQVTTIEGLAAGGALHPVQRAFAELGAMQCGYCTPGLVMAAAALLAHDAAPDDDALRAGLARNLCRCGGYLRQLEAVRRAAAELRGASGAAAPTGPTEPHAAPTRAGRAGGDA